MARLLRIALALAMCVAGLVAFAAPAAAHPTLVATLPEAGYGVPEPPEEIGLIFDERVTVNRFVLEGQARGAVETGEPRMSADGTRVVVRPVAPLPVGRYMVRWQITALDGDIVDGSFGFGVGTAAAPKGATSTTRTGGQGAAAVFRWGLFTAVALALGGLVGEGLARRGVRQASGSGHMLTAPRPWLRIAAALGLAASLGLALHILGGGGLAAGLADASVSRLLDAPGGRLVAVELGAFAAAAIAAVHPFRWVVAVAMAAVVITEGLRSHVHTQAPPVGSITVMMHLAAVAIWVGALIYVSRTALRWRSSPGQARMLFVEYALLALVLYGVVVTTGMLAAVLVLPDVESLWATTYGRVLLAKLGLVVIVSALAVAARRQLGRPHAVRAAIGRARIEGVALVAVLAASAVLTAVAPPADAEAALAYPPPVAGPSVRLGTLAGQVTTGVIASAGRLEVRLRVPGWDPLADYNFDVTGTVTGPGRAAAPLDLRPCGAGCLVGPASWAPGISMLELSVHADGWRGAEVGFEVAWPPRDGRAFFARMLATMAGQPTVTFIESVTSDTTRGSPFRSGELRLSGAEFVDLQPYRSGVVDAPTLLGTRGGVTEIGFAINAENIYVRQELDHGGRVVRETLTSPNHLIERTFSYPAP